MLKAAKTLLNSYLFKWTLSKEPSPTSQKVKTESRKHLLRSRRAAGLSSAPWGPQKTGAGCTYTDGESPCPHSRRKCLVEVMKPSREHQNDSGIWKFHSVERLSFENQLRIRRPHGKRRAAPNIFGSEVLLLIRLNPHGWQDSLELKPDPERLVLASPGCHVTWALSCWHLFLKPDLPDTTQAFSVQKTPVTWWHSLTGFGAKRENANLLPPGFS